MTLRRRRTGFSRRWTGLGTSAHFPPSVVPILWLNGRNGAYSDLAETAEATPFAGRSRSIKQSLPLTNRILAPSDPTRTYRETGAFNFQIGASQYLTGVASSSCQQNTLTIAISINVRDKPEGSPQSLLCSGNNFRLWTFSTNAWTVNYNGTVNNWYIGPSGNLDSNAARTPIGAQAILILRVSPTDMKASVVTNGVRADYVTPGGQAVASSAALAAGSWTIGWDGVTGPSADSMLHGAISQLLLVPRTISDTENEQLLAWLAENQGVRGCPTQIPLVTVSGDSIARAGAGIFGVPIAQSWAMLAQQLLNTTQTVNLVNAAISGDGIVNQRDVTWPTVLAPLYSSQRANNVHILAIGTNDIATLGHTGAVTLADYFAFGDASRAAGNKVVVCTILNRNAGGFFNTEQANFNAALRAGWSARGYSAIADFQAIPQLADPLDPTYFSDGIHPTIAGHALMAPVAQAAAQAAIA